MSRHKRMNGASRRGLAASTSTRQVTTAPVDAGASLFDISQSSGAGAVTVSAEPNGGYTVTVDAFDGWRKRYVFTARGAERVARRARRRIERQYARYLAQTRRAEGIRP